MSTWIVTLQISIPDDGKNAGGNPEAWDWYGLVNETGTLQESDDIEVTVLKVQGVAA